MRTALALGTLVFVLASSAARADGPDYARAGELYKNAEAAMAAGKFEDAARDYGIAFEITQDSVLYFKIASAQEKAGKCPVAITYYNRYLKEAKPSSEFEKLTKERIVACGGTLDSKPVVGTSPAGNQTGSAGGSLSTGGTGGTTITEPSDGKRTPDGAASSGSQGSSATSTPSNGTSGDPSSTTEPPKQPSSTRTAAWVFTGTTIGLVTVGAVLALSASTTQDDLTDLVNTKSPNGQPPEFSGTTKTRYDDLVATGERFQMLSIVSFGVAAATAVTATVLFLKSDSSQSSGTALRPIIGRQFAGLSATLRF